MNLFAAKARTPEIDHFDATACRVLQQDVLGFQVAVDHVLGLEKAKALFKTAQQHKNLVGA